MRSLSRRNFLAAAAAAAPLTVLPKTLETPAAEAATSPTTASTYGQSVPCYGVHQAGVTTYQQTNLVQAAFDITTGGARDVVSLLRRWQPAIEAMTTGRTLPGYDLAGELFPSPTELAAPPVDTGEAVGQGADQLTVTIGFGPSLFDQRFGLGAKRPPALEDLPAFTGDRLLPTLSGGDLGVQICAMTKITAEHAVRTLVRLATGVAVPRWTQSGFYEPPTTGSSKTPRNLMGFKDGTANLDAANSDQMRSHVWVSAADGPAWMIGGTYQVYRLIEIDLKKWDNSTLQTQETTFGRYKASGAPFGGVHEFDLVTTESLGRDSHVRLANPREGERTERERILRRGYSFSEPYAFRSDHPAGGLHFICFQKDPRRQFTTIQHRLAGHDLLNRYVTHTGSALFAIPPGVQKGGYVGQQLFES